ncbi:MAG: ubiquinone biosynthesis methyltransferase UbiE [Paenibacillaceae bacterium]|nr:ubiquinone biosynthesis methyltransferase UbiE [Paenibacillaceae bacterium]
MRMNPSYAFDTFTKTHKQSEIERLTRNVASHSKALCEHFMANGLISSKKVLDVGYGTGAMLNMFASLMPETEFTGVDNSKDILESTNSIAEKNLRFIRSRLPFEDESFDFVYTRLVLMHNSEPLNIVREMRRVCKPGGIVVCVEIDDETAFFYPYAMEFSQLIRANIEYALRRGTDRTMGRKLFGIYKSLGLSNVKVITQTSDYEGPYDDLPFSLRLAMGPDEAKHLVDAELITDEQRMDWMAKINKFCEDPNRFYSGSFMYCFGKKP